MIIKKLNIIDEELNIGDVKTITSNGGENIKYVELLFSPTTKTQFFLSEDKKSIVLSVSDTNLGIPELNCIINKQTLRNYIISLKNMYNELLFEENEG